MFEDSHSHLVAFVVKPEPLSVSLALRDLTNEFGLAVLMVNDTLTMGNILDVGGKFFQVTLLVIHQVSSTQKPVCELTRAFEGEVRPELSQILLIRRLRIAETHIMTMIDVYVVTCKSLALLIDTKRENVNRSRLRRQCCIRFDK